MLMGGKEEHPNLRYFWKTPDNANYPGSGEILGLWILWRD